MVEESLSSSSYPWQMAVVLLLLLPPLAAFLYALVAALFLASFGECPYTQYILPQVVPRLSHLVATVAVVLVVFQEQQSSTHVEQWMFILAGFNWIISFLWIRSTRIQVIEGGPAPSSSVPFALKNKVVVVTGANSGIGKETARALAAMGATVVMACRSVERAQEARRECIESILLQQQQQEKNTKRNGSSTAQQPKMDILQLDLSSLASVRKAAAELNSRYDKIDILINNAGLMMGHQVMTNDGYELVMQANHLGHYLFTRLLIDHYQLLGKSSSSLSKPSSQPQNDNDISRILILSSSMYAIADRIDVEDLFCQKGKRPFSLFGQYAQSKLANLLFANELARRYGDYGIFVAAIHPGMVRTDVVRNMPWYLYYPNTLFASFIAVLQKTPIQGAWNTLYLATAAVSTCKTYTSNGGNGSSTSTSSSTPGGLPSGCYWVNRAVQEKRPCAMDRAGAEQLWTDSAKYVGLTRKEQEPASTTAPAK